LQDPYKVRYQDSSLKTVTSGRYKSYSGMNMQYILVKQIFGTPSRHFTYIFNVFVMMQMMNFLNARKIRDELNCLEGIARNYMFGVILTIIVAGQIIIVTFGSISFSCYNYYGLRIEQWLICFGFALLGNIWSIFLKYVPEDKVIRFNLGWDEKAVKPKDKNEEEDKEKEKDKEEHKKKQPKGDDGNANKKLASAGGKGSSNIALDEAAAGNNNGANKGRDSLTRQITPTAVPVLPKLDSKEKLEGAKPRRLEPLQHVPASEEDLKNNSLLKNNSQLVGGNSNAVKPPAIKPVDDEQEKHHEEDHQNAAKVSSEVSSSKLPNKQKHIGNFVQDEGNNNPAAGAPILVEKQDELQEGEQQGPQE
jgi:hypothetical protein